MVGGCGVSTAGSWLALRILFVGFLRLACRGRRGGQPLKTSGQDAVAGPRSSLMTSVSQANSTAGQLRTRPGSLRWRAPPRRCTRRRGATIHAATTTIERGSTTRVGLKPASRRRRSSRTKEFPTPSGASRTALPGEIPGRRDASSSADGERGTPESNVCTSLADFPHQRYDGVPPPAPLNVRKGLRRDRSDLECHPSCSWSAEIFGLSGFILTICDCTCVF